MDCESSVDVFTVHLTLMMTSAQVVETSVNVTSNSPSQDYTHPDDHNLPNYDMTPGFKPFTVLVDKVNWPPQRD